MNPEDPETGEELIIDDLCIDEIEVQKDLKPSEMEDLNDPRDEVENCHGNSPDAPLAVQTRNKSKHKSYNSENTHFSDSDSGDKWSYSLPGASSDDEDLQESEDPD